LIHLCLFHLYINYIGVTTYEYVRAQRAENERRAREEAEAIVTAAELARECENAPSPPPPKAGIISESTFCSSCCSGGTGKIGPAPDDDDDDPVQQSSKGREKYALHSENGIGHRELHQIREHGGDSTVATTKGNGRLLQLQSRLYPSRSLDSSSGSSSRAGTESTMMTGGTDSRRISLNSPRHSENANSRKCFHICANFLLDLINTNNLSNALSKNRRK
jgi:hypothetical protein